MNIELMIPVGLSSDEQDQKGSIAQSNPVSTASSGMEAVSRGAKTPATRTGEVQHGGFQARLLDAIEWNRQPSGSGFQAPEQGGVDLPDWASQGLQGGNIQVGIAASGQLLPAVAEFRELLPETAARAGHTAPLPEALPAVSLQQGSDLILPNPVGENLSKAYPEHPPSDSIPVVTLNFEAPEPGNETLTAGVGSSATREGHQVLVSGAIIEGVRLVLDETRPLPSTVGLREQAPIPLDPEPPANRPSQTMPKPLAVQHELGKEGAAQGAISEGMVLKGVVVSTPGVTLQPAEVRELNFFQGPQSTVQQSPIQEPPIQEPPVQQPRMTQPHVPEQPLVAGMRQEPSPSPLLKENVLEEHVLKKNPVIQAIQGQGSQGQNTQAQGIPGQGSQAGPTSLGLPLPAVDSQVPITVSKAVIAARYQEQELPGGGIRTQKGNTLADIGAGESAARSGEKSLPVADENLAKTALRLFDQQPVLQPKALSQVSPSALKGNEALWAQGLPAGRDLQPEPGNGTRGPAEAAVPGQAPLAQAPLSPSPLSPTVPTTLPPTLSSLPPAAGLPEASLSPQWNTALVEQVMWMSSQSLNSARITLAPPELGTLEISITVTQEQTSIAFTVQQASVRDALEQQVYRLREMLEQQGLNLADVNVSDHSSSDRHSASHEEGAQGREAAESTLGKDAADMMETDNSPGGIPADSSRRVDYFV
jgi:flagellar hook-length control protein FliK